MDIEKKGELWDRLENEPERAYRAFESFLTLASDTRTVIAAYRRHVGNPAAIKPSDTWARWSSEFAWRERAAAYDDHLESVWREAYERGMEEEAERQGALAERNRNRMNEMLTLGYERAMEWLEDSDRANERLRAGDVIRIIQLHLDATVKLGGGDGPAPGEDDWEEDEREFDRIV